MSTPDEAELPDYDLIERRVGEKSQEGNWCRYSEKQEKQTCNCECSAEGLGGEWVGVPRMEDEKQRKKEYAPLTHSVAEL